MNITPWDPVTQRVAIYSRIIFSDAVQSFSKISNRFNTAPFKTFESQSPMKKQSNFNLNSDGGNVNIFEIQELMGKAYPANKITLNIIDHLKPVRFQTYDETLLEMENLKLAQMKITSKLAKFNFDENSFLQHLDVEGKGKIKLQSLFGVMADKFQMYFSVAE